MPMAAALTKENFFWHKLHSLTGIIPVGVYLLQHLTLNSFSLAGAEQFNKISAFFYSLPHHILFTLELFGLWIPLLFHSIYGIFITGRSEQNYFGTKYKWSQNKMYTLQRITGIFILFFLIYHVITTTVNVKLHDDDISLIDYYAMSDRLRSGYYAVLVVYMLGVLCSAYHFCYGIWNFCIRWGITISERAQLRVQKFAFALFIGVTLLGWAALLGFLRVEGTTPQSVWLTPSIDSQGEGNGEQLEQLPS